jgi:hypothetical protein
MGLVHQATVLLTDAQIKALPTTAVEIVAAPGANLLIVPPAALGSAGFISLSLDWSSDYTNVNAAAKIRVILGGGHHVDYAEDSFFRWGQDVIYLLETLGGGSVAGGYGPNNPSNIVNQPVYFDVTNASDGNFTGGDASNTLRVSVSYLILDTTTGLFV